MTVVFHFWAHLGRGIGMGSGVRLPLPPEANHPIESTGYTRASPRASTCDAGLRCA